MLRLSLCSHFQTRDGSIELNRLCCSSILVSIGSLLHDFRFLSFRLCFYITTDQERPPFNKAFRHSCGMEMEKRSDKRVQMSSHCLLRLALFGAQIDVSLLVGSLVIMMANELLSLQPLLIPLTLDPSSTGFHVRFSNIQAILFSAAGCISDQAVSLGSCFVC